MKSKFRFLAILLLLGLLALINLASQNAAPVSQAVTPTPTITPTVALDGQVGGTNGIAFLGIVIFAVIVFTILIRLREIRIR